MSETVRLSRALEADYPSVVALSNQAYRGRGDGESWNVEDMIEGQRLTDELLREDLAAICPRSHASGLMIGFRTAVSWASSR